MHRIMSRLHPYHYSRGADEAESAFFENVRALRIRAEDRVRSSEEQLRAETTSAVQCKQCTKRSVFFQNIQLRRADEGMSTLYKCRSCGYSWMEK